jgi:hypothetical protein
MANKFFQASISEAQFIVNKIGEKLNLRYAIAPEDYENWLSGEYCNNFDLTVEELIGGEAYAMYNELARLDAALRYNLNIGPRFAGGIDLKYAKQL